MPVVRSACLIAVAVIVALSGAPLASVAADAKTAEASSTTATASEAVAAVTTNAAARPGSSLWDSLQVRALWENNGWLNWTVLGAAVILGLLVGTLVASLLYRAAQRLPSHGWEARREALTALAGPIKLAFLTLGLGVGLTQLVMSSDLLAFARKCLLLLGSIAVAWYAYNLIGALDPVLRRRASRFDTMLKDQLVPLIRKLLRTLLVVTWALFVIQAVFGGDIGAWLAGLGIAGLAVSLAAQDSLKNLFGSLTILFDRPFQVGDRIKFAGYEGVVSEIGFRSTKIKTAEGHLVTIPNLKIVAEPVENLGDRRAIQRTINLALPRKTPREKVERAVEIVRDILNEDGIREPIHPTVNGERTAPRVYFSEFTPDKLVLVATYSYAPPVQAEYAEHAQRVNLRIMAEFEKNGIELV